MTALKAMAAALALMVVSAPPASARQNAEIVEFVGREAEGMEAAHVPGLVFVMVDGEGLVAADAIGMADLASGRAMTLETPLRVGSISKPVTAALALELASHGVIDLDVPVDRYLDRDLSDRYGEASTIRQLLEHRGGYADAFLESHHLDPRDALDLDQWLERLGPRTSAPGVVASYSSLDYTLVGAAIAGATGARYAEIAERELFEPLGMPSADFFQPAPADVATGYAWEHDGYRPYPNQVPDLVPGVGLVASAEDVAAFMRGLLAAGSPLDVSTRKGLLSTQGPGSGLRGYTLGLTEWRYGSRSVLYHEGNGVGTTSRMMILPDEGIGVFTAVNAETLTGLGDPSSPTLFVRDLHRALIDEFFPSPFELPGSSATGSAANDVAGVYVPTRIDAGSPLGLEGLVSQFEVADEGDGLGIGGNHYVDLGQGVFASGSDRFSFLAASDGVYATSGGTNSYRRAAWWETTTFNAAWMGMCVVALLIGTWLGLTRSAGRGRWSVAAAACVALGFLALLTFGVMTLDAMDLFTRLPWTLRAAQAAAAGVLVSSVGLAVLVVLRWGRSTPRWSAGTSMVAAAMLAMSVWASAWGLLPI